MRRQALSLQIAFCAVGQVVGKAELAWREFLKIALKDAEKSEGRYLRPS
jgi:hypothetical protein